MATEVVEVATESEAKRTCVRFRYSGKNLMRFAVFWRISVRFCGFRAPLTPPSVSKRRLPHQPKRDPKKSNTCLNNAYSFKLILLINNNNKTLASTETSFSQVKVTSTWNERTWDTTSIWSLSSSSSISHLCSFWSLLSLHPMMDRSLK